ncbi:MAG TPA: hypothetical protein VGS27_30210 [Candidatus Sulfotelmatobacter sp.]|nr:hypothetical protein [Candidatus Sulfotelmatobacter sp.]
MACRIRIALLLFVFGIVPLTVFSQDSVEKKPAERDAPDQSAEHNYSGTHCEVPACATKVIYFSNISQVVDMQDAVNVMRAIVEMPRVQMIMAARVIVVEGTPEQVAMGEKLAAEIDKAKRRFGGLGYHFDVKVSESDGSKSVHTRVYSFVNDGHEPARLSTGRPVPPPAPNEAGSEKQAVDSGNTHSIECRILAENERTLELIFDAGLASETGRELGAPLVRIRQHVTVELDRPTLISKVDNPETGHSFTVELTASRIKEKP